MLAAPLPLAGICFLISTRGTPPAVPVPGAVWEGQAEDQGLGEAGSPVPPRALADLGVLPQLLGSGGEKRGQKGATEARQREERDRTKKAANANGRVRKDAVGGVSTPGHDIHSRHLDQNITEIEKRKCY